MNLKNSHSRRRAHSGYGCIGLGVIVGLALLILFDLTFASNRPLKGAYRAKARAQAENIRQGVANYYAEYGHYPFPRGTGKVDVYYSSKDMKSWGPLIIALCGGIDPSHPDRKLSPALLTVPNERGIPFISLNPADLDTSSGVGIPKQPMADANGNAQFFFIAMDGNGDGVLGDKDQAAGKLPDFQNKKLGGAVIKEGVAVWGNGEQSLKDGGNFSFWSHTY